MYRPPPSIGAFSTPWMVPGMYQVQSYLRVRRAVMVEGVSVREAARVFGLHRVPVRKMLAYSVPPGYRRQSPPKRLALPPPFTPPTGAHCTILCDPPLALKDLPTVGQHPALVLKVVSVGVAGPRFWRDGVMLRWAEFWLCWKTSLSGNASRAGGPNLRGVWTRLCSRLRFRLGEAMRVQGN